MRSMPASINVNLASGRLVVNNVPGLGTLNFTVLNFVNVIGTANRDTIAGSNGNNNLNGNGGNDRIVGGQGDDTIAGGSGNDTLDYSSLGRAITLIRGGIVDKSGLGTDRLQFDIETIIGATGQANTIDASTGVTASLNVDLARNQLLISGTPAGDLRFNVRNFVNVLGSGNADTIVGNNGNNSLNGGGGNDTFRTNRGNDTVVGGDGTDTIDYTGIGRAVTILQSGTIVKASGWGRDRIQGVETIVGDAGQANAIDASSSTGAASLDVNLNANRLAINNVPNLGTLLFNVQNFVNITGTSNNDKLTGNRANNIIIGGLGDDLVRGGTGFDNFVLNNSGLDTISDFETGVDTIRLFGIEDDYTFDRNSIFFGDRQIANIGGTGIGAGDLVFSTNVAQLLATAT
jgi:Ca2+-binding RTX toxin-like protein